MSEERLARIEAALDRQVDVNAGLRASLEVLRAGLSEIRGSVEDTRASVEALLQIAQIHQQNFERLVEEFQRHRIDGHGG